MKKYEKNEKKKAVNSALFLLHSFFYSFYPKKEIYLGEDFLFLLSHSANF